MQSIERDYRYLLAKLARYEAACEVERERRASGCRASRRGGISTTVFKRLPTYDESFSKPGSRLRNALVIVLVGFVLTDSPWFGLDKDNAEHVRAVGPLVAIWFVVFVWPLFLYTPDRPSRNLDLGTAISEGLTRFVTTLRNVRQNANTARFLLAHMIYNDGLTVVFAIGAIFAAATFGMNEQQLIIFGIVLNVTAGFGAFGFAWLDDSVGPKLTIIIALFGMLLMGIAALVITELTYFWVAAALFGIFMGSAQAASRSLMARLALPEARTELFGLFAFSGKATAFVGTLIAGGVTAATASQRAGRATAVVFIAVGLVLLLGVREPARQRSAAN